ncbi:MAG: glycosyltransferase, partial [Alphaproteobacteria bacterium]|nr:glycosyltransferase [Alphaproteobacteria bacterium]
MVAAISHLLMHFCHIVTGLLAGPEVIVRQLLEAQMSAGHRVSLIFSTLHGGDDRVIQNLPRGADLVRWDALRSIDLGRDYQSLKELLGILRQLRPDLVHMHNSKAG